MSDIRPEEPAAYAVLLRSVREHLASTHPIVTTMAETRCGRLAGAQIFGKLSAGDARYVARVAAQGVMEFTDAIDSLLQRARDATDSTDFDDPIAVAVSLTLAARALAQ